MTIRFWRVRGEAFGCLSNFSRHSITYRGKLYQTSEHLYQSLKFRDTDPEWGEVVRTAGWAGDAAAKGRDKSHRLHPDWDEVKVSVMRQVLKLKFDQNPECKRILLSTGSKDLVEASPIDWYWGTGKDETGVNMLGILLMELRTRYQAEEAT